MRPPIRYAIPPPVRHRAKGRLVISGQPPHRRGMTSGDSSQVIENKPDSEEQTNTDATETGAAYVARLEADLAAYKANEASMASDAESPSDESTTTAIVDVDNSYIHGIIGSSDHLMNLNDAGAVALPPLSSTQEPLIAGPVVNGFLLGAA